MKHAEPITKNILLRGKKDFFNYLSAETSLKENSLGSNSGNLIFLLSAHKILSAPGVQITPYLYGAHRSDAKFINENYDYFVLPFANAFRPEFQNELKNYTSLIKKLKIPVIVLGCGVQATLDYNFSTVASINKITRKFVNAVLDKSSSIGVRGECTAEYLKQLGYSHNEIDIIGCPSMFLNGDKLIIRNKKLTLDQNSKIAFNASPYVKTIDLIGDYNFNHYDNIYYIPQNNIDLEALLYGTYPPNYTKKSTLYDIKNSYFKKNKVRFFVDPKTWMNFLADFDFSFGTRIHGNITAALAGTPCHILVHDSRTLELARHFDIPHTLISDTHPHIKAQELYEKSDYNKMQTGHKKRYEIFADFLKKNNLPNIFNFNGESEKFDKLYDSTVLPSPVEPLKFVDKPTLRKRIKILKEWQDFEMS